MPELPEVEAVRRSLLPHLIGKTMEQVEVLHPKTTRETTDFAKRLLSKTFKDIDRVGKLLIFTFAEMDDCMLAHLKMTGQFFYIGADAKVGGGHSFSKSDTDLPGPHTRVIFQLSDGSTLYFNDMRLFGYVKLEPADEVERIKSTYGIEPGTQSFTKDEFERRLRRRNTTLKAILLNQAVISGLGNIYVDEACHQAKALPMRNVQSLNETELSDLCVACEEIIKNAVALGGTTFRNYSDGLGRMGGYRAKLQVFGRDGEPCPRCGHIIEKTRCAGRGTHYCSGCQK